MAAGIFLFSCEKPEEAEPSSEASITSLTLTIESTDYDVTFTDKQGKITVPYATPLPVTARVKTVVLSAKAKGVKVGDTLTIPVSGTVTLTVTAEDDKTTGVYTLTVEKASASKEPLTLSPESIAQGDTTLTIKADESITLTVADDAALLAGIQVYRTPYGGTRSTDNTDNIATAATLHDNKITVTINTKAEQGDQFFVHIAADMVQGTAGNKNTAITGDNELSFKLPAPTNPFIVAELPKSTNTLGSTGFVPDKYRTHFVTFSIRTGAAVEGEYRLGLKVATAPAPTANELTTATAAITRTVSATTINIYLPFHIDGTYFDDGVTQDYATARATTLDPDTDYTLYLTKTDGSGEVVKLPDFTTDAAPTGITDRQVFYGVPSDDYTYTIRDGDQRLLFVFESPRGDFTFLAASIDGDQSANCVGDSCTVNPKYNIHSYRIMLSALANTVIMSFDESAVAGKTLLTGTGGPTSLSATFTTQPTP